MKKIKTGIRNLDKLLGGGIPKGATVLVKGAPGTGKTNIGLEFLLKGAEKGQNGLFVSFQENKEEILNYTSFKWNIENTANTEKLNFRKLDPYRSGEVPEMVRGSLKENSAERAVLDPVTDLDLYLDSRKDIRKNLLSLEREFKERNVTSLLIAENEEATEIEEEIADGIIELEQRKKDGKIQKTIYVRKLRGSDYVKGVHSYSFDENGMKVE
ncbi:MAG: RAD55 family ATPase [Candidatus Nanohaloarchaea archaeon]